MTIDLANHNMLQFDYQLKTSSLWCKFTVTYMKCPLCAVQLVTTVFVSSDGC